MTNREAIERVKSLYQAGVASDDSRMSNRLIYSVLSTAKAHVLRKEADKYRSISERNFDYLECVGVSQAEPHDCPCAPPSGCLILKSNCPLPRPLTTKYGDYIQVTSIDGTKSFSKTTWIAKSKKRGNKYTSKTQDFFFKDDYLFITVPEPTGITLKVVTVSGVFEDITDFECNYCEGCEEVTSELCTSPLDKEFKLDYSMMESVINIAVQELIRMFMINNDDRINNANDDIQEQNSQRDARRPIQ